MKNFSLDSSTIYVFEKNENIKIMINYNIINKINNIVDIVDLIDDILKSSYDKLKLPKCIIKYMIHMYLI